MLGTDGDEVAVIDIVDGGGGVAVYGGGVGILRVAVLRNVAAAEHAVVNQDTAFRAVGILGHKVIPCSIPQLGDLVLSFQRVQVVGGHVVILLIASKIGLGLQLRRNDHLAVLGQLVALAVTAIVVIVPVVGRTRGARGVGFFFSDSPGVEIAPAIDIADVAAAEDVAIAVGHTVMGAHLAAVDVNLGLSEHVAVGVERTLLAIAPDVVALAAAEDVASDVAVVHLDERLAGMVDGRHFTHGIFLFGRTASDGGNLAAAMHTVAHHAAIDSDVALIDAASHVVAAAEHIAAVLQTAITLIGAVHIIGLVVDFLLVVAATVGVVREVFRGFVGEEAVTDVSVVKFQVGGAKHGTTLTASVCITLDGGNALV